MLLRDYVYGRTFEEAGDRSRLRHAASVKDRKDLACSLGAGVSIVLAPTDPMCHSTGWHWLALDSITLPESPKPSDPPNKSSVFLFSPLLTDSSQSVHTEGTLCAMHSSVSARTSRLLTSLPSRSILERLLVARGISPIRDSLLDTLPMHFHD